MIHTALASDALPGAPAQTVLQAARDAGLDGVEWSATGYLVPGDIALAEELMMQTLRAGLCSSSYASQFRVGLHDHGAFRRVLDSAATLHAPMVRVWMGPRGVGTGFIDDRGRAGSLFADEIMRLGDEAGELGITLCFSFARGSILDSYDSAISLFPGLKHPFVKLVWEHLEGADFDTAREAFAALSGRIGMLVARGMDDDGDIRTLGDSDEEWIEYLDAFDEQGGSPDMVRHVLLRAFKDGDPGKLADDALRIREWSRRLRQYHRRRVY